MLHSEAMNIATRIFLAALLLSFAAGCASDQDQSNQNPNASSIPWDHPQSWEGQGMMGSFNQPQGSTGHN